MLCNMWCAILTFRLYFLYLSIYFVSFQNQESGHETPDHLHFSKFKFAPYLRSITVKVKHFPNCKDFADQPCSYPPLVGWLCRSQNVYYVHIFSLPPIITLVGFIVFSASGVVVRRGGSARFRHFLLTVPFVIIF